MTLILNSKIYPLQAILNTCYIFIDRLYIFLDSDTKGERIKVFLKQKKLSDRKNLESLRGEFMNELLHSSLRYAIGKNNKKLREYIIGRALCSCLPSFDSIEDNKKLDYQEDPMGIAIPWEKKYGKNKRRASNKV